MTPQIPAVYGRKKSPAKFIKATWFITDLPPVSETVARRHRRQGSTEKKGDYSMPPRERERQQKPFEGLDAPLDRWLRVIYERDMWSCGPSLKERYAALLDEDALEEEASDSNVSVFHEPFEHPLFEPAPEPDFARADEESLFELRFS